MSRVYSLKAVQLLNTTLEDAWDFFSNPQNLAAITPTVLGFTIINEQHGETMYPGQIIEYTIKPLLGIPVYWMTEITHVQQHQFFIDEQRFGPYALWHHQHHFKTKNNVVEMTDIVHYKIPYWFIGDIANAILVKRKLREIFEYRYKSIEERYGANMDGKCSIKFK